MSAKNAKRAKTEIYIFCLAASSFRSLRALAVSSVLLLSLFLWKHGRAHTWHIRGTYEDIRFTPRARYQEQQGQEGCAATCAYVLVCAGRYVLAIPIHKGGWHIRRHIPAAQTRGTYTRHIPAHTRRHIPICTYAFGTKKTSARYVFAAAE